MTVVGVARLLARHLVLVSTCAVAGLLVALALASFVVTPSYTVSMKLYVAARGSTADDRLQNGEYARTHVSSYTDMVDSNDVLQAVRENLGLPANTAGGYQDLAANITATNPLDTLIINVTVEGPSAQRALLVATAIGDVYDPVVAGMEGSAAGQSPVRINVLSAPVLPTSPHSPSQELYTAAGLLLGALLGAGAAVLVDRRPTSGSRASGGEGEGSGWHWQVDPHLRLSKRDEPDLMTTPSVQPVPTRNGSRPATAADQTGARKQSSAAH